MNAARSSRVARELLLTAGDDHGVAAASEVGIPRRHASQQPIPQPALPARRICAAGWPVERTAHHFRMADHAYRPNFEAGAGQHQLQRIRRKMCQMPRQIETAPVPPNHLKGKLSILGRADDQLAAGCQQPISSPQHFERLMHMFQRMPHGDDVEARLAQFRMRQGTDESAQTQIGANALDRLFGSVDAGDLPASLVHAQKKCAAAAAEIEQPAIAVTEQILEFLCLAAAPRRPLSATCFTPLTILPCGG